MISHRNTFPLPFRHRLLISEIASLLMAGGYIGQYFSAYNRFYLFFGMPDVWAILLLVFGVGAGAAVVLQGLACWTRGRSDSWLSSWFYFWVVLTLAQFFPNGRKQLVEIMPWLSGTLYYLMLWGVGAALAVGGYFVPTLRAGATTGWRLVRLLWPLLFLVPLNLLLADRWDNEQREPVSLGKNTAGQGAPVVMIILDKMGYSEVLDPKGRVHSHLPYLSSYASTAMVFHDAQSCGHLTIYSLPGFLLQEKVDLPQLNSDGVSWSSPDDRSEDFRRANEFTRALPIRFQEDGGRAVLFGYYLPWSRMMPGMWDAVHSVSFYGVCRASPKPAFKLVVVHHLARYLKYHSKGPFGALLKTLDKLDPLYMQYIRDLTTSMVKSAKTFFRDSLSPGDLVVIHLVVPHEPFVFDADGNPSRYAPFDYAGYPDQLCYADRLVGEFVEVLQQTGHWDDSWVLVTSDHGVHQHAYGRDPVEIRHVPLLVKAPGQTRREDIHTPVRLWALEDIPGFPLPVGSPNRE